MKFLHAIRDIFQRPTSRELLEFNIFQGKLIMATLTDVQTAFTAQQASIQTAVTLLQGLKARVDAGGGAASSADLDTIVSQLNSSKSVIDAAVTANTPT